MKIPRWRFIFVFVVLGLVSSAANTQFAPYAHAQTTTVIPISPSTVHPAGVAAKNVSFDFGDGWIAQGQITYPANKPGPFPTVILVHGSGLNDMDETLPEAASGFPGGSKFFLPIADYLPTRGFAVVRYNKRGVIGIGPQVSTDPRFTTAIAKPFTQYVKDATFVLNQTLENPLVDPAHVYMLGHSEGTLTVSLIARSAAGAHVAGLILMGVVGVDIKTTLQYQLVDKYVIALHTADSNGDGKLSPAEILAWAQTGATEKLVANQLLTQDSATPPHYVITKLLDTNGDNLLDIDAELAVFLQNSTGIAKFPNIAGANPSFAAWLTDFQNYGSVTTVLPGFTKPVLMQNGEADIQTRVIWAQMANAALTQAGNPDHTLLTYPSLGHTLYPAHGLDQPLGTPQSKPFQDTAAWLIQHTTSATIPPTPTPVAPTPSVPGLPNTGFAPAPAASWTIAPLLGLCVLGAVLFFGIILMRRKAT